MDSRRIEILFRVRGLRQKAVDVRGILAPQDLRPVVILHQDNPHRLDVRRLKSLRSRTQRQSGKQRSNGEHEQDENRFFHVALTAELVWVEVDWATFSHAHCNAVGMKRL